MNIWEINKFQLFLVFFIPGFISIKVYDLLVPSERRDFSKAVVEAVGYSALNFAILSWLIVTIVKKQFLTEHPVWHHILLLCVLFLFPVIWAVLFVKIPGWPFVSRWIPHPVRKPWDWVFRKGEVCWIIVHLKDGRKVGGIYNTNSFASSDPAKEQIYLQQVWHLDKQGRFLTPVDRSKGILVLGEDISFIEFFGN